MKIDANVLLTAKIIKGEGGGGETPSGTVTLTSNGTHNVARYARANVAVPEPSGSTTITENGTHNVADYASAVVAVPEPSGSVTITENGTHNVANYASAVVAVPAGAQSDFLPDETIYKRYDDAAVLPEERFEHCRPGKSVSFSWNNLITTEPAVGDKILLTGQIANSNDPVAVWGTVTRLRDYTNYTSVTLALDGASARTVDGRTREITDNGEVDVFGYAKVSVAVPMPNPGVEMATRQAAELDLSTVQNIAPYAFYHYDELLAVSMPDVEQIGARAFDGCSSLVIEEWPENLALVGEGAFAGVQIGASETPSNLTALPQKVFEGATFTQAPFTWNCSRMEAQSLQNTNLQELIYAGTGSITYRALYGSTVETITITKSISYIDPTAFANCANLTDIFVPWAEGAVSGAPWGATGATIHYNS